MVTEKLGLPLGARLQSEDKPPVTPRELLQVAVTLISPKT